MTSESGPSGIFKSGLKQENHRRGRSGHRKPQKPPEERLDYFAAGAEIKDENGIRCVEIGNRIGDWGCRHNAYDKDKLMDVLEHHNVSLHRLVLAECQNVTDEALPYLKFCTQLLELNLSGCCEISDRCIEGVAANCRTLKSVGLRDCSNVSDKAVLEFARSCKNLTALDVSRCNLITDHSLEAMSKTCTSLTSLYLGECIHISTASVKLFGQHARDLKHLDLHGIPTIGDTAISAVGRHCQHLEMLNLADCNRISDTSIGVIGQRCPNLLYLNLRNCYDVTDWSMADLARKCTQLTFLDLANCKDIGDETITLIATGCGPRLKYLDLRKCDRITDVSGSLLGNCTSLTHLSLLKCTKLTDDTLLPIATNCSKLNLLHLRKGKPQDPGVKLLGEQQRDRGATLTALDLGNCTWLTDESVEKISHCTLLRKLNLRKVTKATDLSLRLIPQNCRKLEQLNLSHCKKVFDKTIYDLALKCCEMQHLDLSWCERVTDWPIIKMAQTCRKITHLDVGMCPLVTSAVLPHFERLGVIVIRSPEYNPYDVVRNEDKNLEHFVQKHAPGYPRLLPPPLLPRYETHARLNYVGRLHAPRPKRSFTFNQDYNRIQLVVKVEGNPTTMDIICVFNPLFLKVTQNGRKKPYINGTLASLIDPQNSVWALTGGEDSKTIEIVLRKKYGGRRWKTLLASDLDKLEA